MKGGREGGGRQEGRKERKQKGKVKEKEKVIEPFMTEPEPEEKNDMHFTIKQNKFVIVSLELHF